MFRRWLGLRSPLLPSASKTVPRSRHYAAVAALAAGGAMAACGWARSETWTDTVSTHFVIRRQTSFTVGASPIDLERLHNRLRLDLASFSPWMANERITVYLYPDSMSYREGEFHPPAWSDGMAFYDRRAIAVYAHRNPQALDRIIAHETTHILFESYWAEANKMPPSWLNEGLAMMEETERGDEESKSEWYQAMASLGPRGMISFPVLTSINPALQIKGKLAASYWYVAAYSAVYFLYRHHASLQFNQFCKNLRDGVPLEQALWTDYRYETPEKFEAAWKGWLAELQTQYAGRRLRPGMRPPDEPDDLSEAQDSQGSGQRLKPIDFRSFGFHSFRDH